MDIIIIILISLGFAWLLYEMAKKRGANANFWCVMGFLFGPFAIPFLFFKKPRKDNDS